MQDSEKSLIITLLRCQAALSPRVGPGDGSLILAAVVWGRAFIEGHDDVRAELFLDGNDALWCEAKGCSIEMGFKRNPICIDLALVG